MSGFFVLLLEQVTIFSSVTAVILIAVKLLFKCRIPPKIGLALWTVLLARLLCPIFPESSFSIYNFIPVGRDLTYAIQNDVNEEFESRLAPREEAVNPYILLRKTDPAPGEVPAESPDTPSASPSLVLSSVLSEDGSGEDADTVNRRILLVWCLGIGISLTVSVLFYALARRRALRMTEPCADPEALALYAKTAARLGIRERRIPPLRCGPAPMLVGCARPVVIFRDDVNAQEAEIVFSHELTHYRYHDNPLLVFSTFVNCLFWYNPLIWVVRRMLREDVEVLCDNRTLEFCGIPGTEYAMMLCRDSAFDALTAGAGCSMSQKGRHLKNRLRIISHQKHRRFLPRAASWLLCAAIIAVCLTNPIVSQNTAYADYITNYAALTGGDEREMRLAPAATVSDHLAAIDALLSANGREEARSALGRGSFELFRRLANETVSPDLCRELNRYKADEVLSVRSLAVVDACAAAMLGGAGGEPDPFLLPARISVPEMEAILGDLSESDGALLLAAYNRGVKGAIVQLDPFYTPNMMELILSRIRDTWAREKFAGFYQEIDLTAENRGSFSTELDTALSALRDAKTVFVRDPGITRVEVETLGKILGAAAAGEREDVYYRKRTADTVPFEQAARILRRSGFTADRMLADTARIGEPAGEAGNAERFPLLRESARGGAVTIVDARAEVLYDAIDLIWRLGILDADGQGWLDPQTKLTYGENLSAAYRFAVSEAGLP